MDALMNDADVRWLRSREPFAAMNAKAFPRNVPLEGILRFDCKLRRSEPGEIIYRQGDYGGSAFLVLAGSVRVVMDPLPDQQLGRQVPEGQHRWFQRIYRRLFRPAIEEYRPPSQISLLDTPGGNPIRRVDGRTAIFLQDFDAILRDKRTVSLGPSELFGEISAMCRLPRTANVIAENEATLIEIRWQGLQMLRCDQRFAADLDLHYRTTWLPLHLKSISPFRNLPDDNLTRLADASVLRSFGHHPWDDDLKRTRRLPVAEPINSEPINSEPIIAEAGRTPTELIFIRNGFARVTRQADPGHRDSSMLTTSYLGKGDGFGLEEVIGNATRQHGSAPIPLQHSLRAVGITDTIGIPAEVFAAEVLPWLPPQDASQRDHATSVSSERLDFIIANRLNNGTDAMVIDLDRCTQCNDCLKACAEAHDGNARFEIIGPVHANHQFVQACMHCADPVCMMGCPTGAIARDPATGSIRIHEPICVGCGVCAEGCPYDSIRMVTPRDRNGHVYQDAETAKPVQKATKCDRCHSRPSGPACVSACGQDALVRIDLTDPSPLDSLGLLSR
ncbi:4Fe-4S dicluster domain-containing protein [Novipirellula artificiosorum]|uniref:Hydrogenase-4 component A n=1 Tax=Novipirellula artificiosorum TaxID=2528016 RepID=A0A5C6DI94_9BACT|nr:4Fe-4S dicluster domain-containing protein [Novipirellula artificiosorum]TWU35925.1 Hydrogenase-4 component A [Novipirellula artificiosorum]